MRLVALVALAGCDQTWGLLRVPDAAIDATPQAAMCPTSPAGLCADFDEDPPVVYVQGAPTMLTLTASQATAAIAPIATAPSQPNALELHSMGGTWSRAYPPGTTFTRMTASFDVRIEHLGAANVGYSGLVRLTANNTTLSSCFVDFIIDETQPASLGISEHCDNGNGGETPVRPGAIPAGWFHVDFTLDLSFPRAWVLIDGQNEVDLNWGTPVNITNKTPEIEFGLMTPDDGLAFAIDNLVVVTT